MDLGCGDRLELAVRPVGVLADHAHATVVDDAGVDHDAVALAEAGHAVADGRDEARSVRAEDSRLRHGGQALPNPDVQVVQAGRSKRDQHLAGSATGSGTSSYESTSAPPSSWIRTAFTRQNPRMTAAELSRLASELGLDAVGAAPAEPYESTEEHIRDRRARGLFADMRFTMARPEVSCHPERLLDGARTVVSAALCYYEPGPGPGTGRRALAPLHVAGRLRGSARATRRARNAPRWALPRARGRERPRRP